MDARARALETLYRERYSSFRNMVATITGSYESAHDVVQDAFADDLRHRESFRGDGSLAAWVWRIAIRQAWRWQSAQAERRHLGAPPGMAPGVIAGQTRMVLDVPISENEHVVVWAAPTKAGGYCVEYSLERIEGPHGEGGGGCDAERSIALSPTITVPGPISSEGRIQKGPVIIGVSDLHPSATVVEIEFEDGSQAQVPLTWISEPIDAGFAVYVIPEEHWYSPDLPSDLVVRDAGGRELDRDREFLGLLEKLGTLGTP